MDSGFGALRRPGMTAENVLLLRATLNNKNPGIAAGDSISYRA
jgi:hypothetical protein